MYLPSYKLNHSFTVYVNCIYLNDCIKACRNRGAGKPSCSYAHANKSVSFAAAPLPENTLLQHKLYGTGRVVSSENNILKVEFESKVAKFIYPDAIRQGFLTRVFH